MAGKAAERAVRWERARQRHEDALRWAGWRPGRARRRLRYAALTPAGPLVRAAVTLGLAAYLAWSAVRGQLDGAAVLRGALLAAAVLLLSTNRASVSEAGLSFDVAGLRKVTSFGFVPLYAVTAAVAGPRPEGWPRGPWHGARLPGRGRVHVRFEDSSGEDKVRSAWVRDPERYARTVLDSRPEKEKRSRGRRRR
jgi:hypothetical protein